MDLAKYKPAKKGGAKKAAEIFKNTRKKQPSDRLVQIISEISEVENEHPKKPDDRAAKPVEI
ncbi:MAG: hypothetical protein ACOYOK_14895 [Pseudobdellovibrionaceae bacterium]